MVPDSEIPVVNVDNHGLARMAADHLLERGFRHFGCVSIRSFDRPQQWVDTLVDMLATAGCQCEAHFLPLRTRTYDAWEKEQNQLAQWVRRLPKPVGIMACDDIRGQRVLEACQRVGVLVPEEAAVIGVDNDETICVVCSPPLSTVDAGHTRVGYQAGSLLDRLMCGEDPPAEPTYVSPVGVVTRQSTDILAIEDHEVATAVRFIREHAFGTIRVDEVVRHVSLSQSALQRRFRRLLGRSIHDEIVRVRIHRACELLVETEMPIGVIAAKSGFRHQAYMGVVFQEKLGKTPRQYREQAYDL